MGEVTDRPAPDRDEKRIVNRPQAGMPSVPVGAATTSHSLSMAIARMLLMPMWESRLETVVVLRHKREELALMAR